MVQLIGAAEQMLSRNRWLKDYPMINLLDPNENAQHSLIAQKKAWLSNQNGYLVPILESLISRVDNFMFSHNFNKLDTKAIKLFYSKLHD